MSLPLFGFYFGSGNSYFVYGPQGWQSDGIGEAERTRLANNITNNRFPRTSQGVGSTYVTVNAQGQAWFRLDGKYPQLETALRTKSAAIEMVALNPYVAGSFLVVYKHGGGYLCRLPTAYQSAVVEFVCAGMLPMLQQAQVQQAQTQNFLTNLLFTRF